MKGKLHRHNLGIVLVIVAIFVAAQLLSDLRPPSSQIVDQYVTADVVRADGRTAHYDDKNFGRVDRGDVVTLRLRLPAQPIFEHAALVFFDYNAVTEVRCGDTLLAAYGADIAASGRMIGNRFFQIPLPDEAWGEELTITVCATERNAFSNFTNLRVFPTEYAYRFYTDVDLSGVVCALLLLALSVLGAAACLLSRMRGAALANALYLLLTMLLVSLWLTANEGINMLLGLDGYVWQPLEYMAGYTAAIPLLLFYRSMARGRSRWPRLFGAAAALLGGAFAVATVLNFTNLLHYHALMGVEGALIASACLLMLAYTIRSRGAGGKAQTLMSTGAYIFLPIALYEALLRALFTALPLEATFRAPPLLALGVLMFLLCQICAFVSDLYERQKDLMAVQIQANVLDELISKTPAGICQIVPDENLTIISANELFSRIIGYDKEEFGGERPRDIVSHLSESGRRMICQRVWDILGSPKNTGEFELSATDQSGLTRDLSVRYYHDRGGDGRITANVVDITARRRVEQELELLEQEYRIAAQLSDRQVFIYDVKTRTARQLPELKKLLELPEEPQDIQETLLELDILGEEARRVCTAFFDDILSGKESGGAYLHLRPREAAGFRWFRAEFSSIFNENGAPVRAVISLYDATEQHENELAYKRLQLSSGELPDALFKSYERNLTRDVVEGEGGAAFVCPASVLTSFGSAQILERVNARVCPEHVGDFIRFISRERLLTAYKHGLTSDRMELRIIAAGGEKLWFEAQIQMLEDPFSGDVKAYYLLRNIDEAKRRELRERRDMEEMRRELENSRIKVMINQMQPHFLYNALSSIQMITKVDPDRAYRLMHDFTVHLRGSIKALSSDSPIPFREELNNVRAYLNIEMMRFEGSLRVDYDIRCEDFTVVPLTIQPLVENAVKHGVFPKGEEGGTVSVRSYETADAFAVEVEDDGAGFDAEKTMAEEKESYGLKNLIFRLRSLMRAEIAFDSQPGRGTKITVTIPKRRLP